MKKSIIATTIAVLSISTTSYGTEIQNLNLNTDVGQLSANLYLPENKENVPIVVVTGAWTTVKEQMPAIYAEELTKNGYAALTFDFRGWGESQDHIKYLEDPQRKIEDIKAVINSIKELDYLDINNIYGLGICASSGYMLDASLNNNNIQAVATVAPWLHNKELVNVIYGGEESVSNLIQTGIHSLTLNNENQNIIEGASTTNKDSLMFNAPYYTEKDRGLIKEWDNKFNLSSWAGWLTYDALKNASKQDKPTLLINSEDMALPQGAKNYIKNAQNNVKGVWLEGISQFDFYDNKEVVETSIKHIVKHFNENKKG